MLAMSFLATINTAHAESVERVVRNYFQDVPVMVTIAGCESTFRQYDENGEVLKNPSSSARGVFQIMSSLHRNEALRLGFDIYTLEGNILYARHLYRTQGTRPWNASKHCWG